MPKTSATGSAGFTLIELLVVLAILVIATAMVPLFFSTRAIQARRIAAGAQRLVAALQETQGLSTQYGAVAHIRAAGNSLQVTFSSVHERSRPQRLYPIDAPLSQLTASGQPLDDAAVYPDGSASPARFLVGTEEQHAVVAVSPVTGHISLDHTP